MTPAFHLLFLLVYGFCFGWGAADLTYRTWKLLRPKRKRPQTYDMHVPMHNCDCSTECPACYIERTVGA